jgi:hypothetical protein
MDMPYVAAKLDDINEKIANIDKTLAVNTELLAEHIKRTELLEGDLKEFKEKTGDQMQDALLPIKFARGAVEVSKIGSVIASIGAGIWAILKFLHLR